MGSGKRHPETAMSLMGHLTELRNRLVWSVGAIGIAAVLAFTLGNEIIRILLVPFPDNVQVVQIDVLEGIRVRTRVALLGGFVIAFPVIVYHVVMFIRPALLPHERRALLIFLPVVAAFYVTGVLFCFFVLIPPMMAILPFFLGDLAEPQIRIESIIGMEVWLLFTSGLVFEIPVVMFLLTRVGILNPRVLSRHRRLAMLLSVVAAAVITPTGDPFNMVIWAVPIWGLYEIGALLARVAYWQRQRAVKQKRGTASAR